MKRRLLYRVGLSCTAIGVLLTGGHSQSLTDKLAEEETFYTNYGKEMYAKLKIERDVIGLYDGFGKHIVDGVELYRLKNEAAILTNQDQGVSDSVDFSESEEYQKRDFYEKFANLVVTQDAIGGVKTSFLIGDQITTRFTPLTFNKTNFRGVRWDLWSSGLQFSFLFNRTRPGFVSTKEADGTGSAIVEYPITRESVPQDMYDRRIRGDNGDWSSTSPYGDYDFLWALHAENTIANKVDVGLTYINHHTNDIKKGPHPFKGELPDSLMPNHIHFEFYDLTPDDSTDAGVFVDSVIMYVNGKEVEAKPAYRDRFMRVFVGDRDDVLLPRALPIARPQSGDIPIIVEFKTDPQFWRNKDGSPGPMFLKDVKKVKFRYKVAGNYSVFVSTDRQIPLAIDGEYNPETRRVDYFYPTKEVGDIYDRGQKISESGGPWWGTSPHQVATTYFGEYVAQSPRLISISAAEFENVTDKNYRFDGSNDRLVSSRYNYKQYTYEYNVNVSSVTYGLNFRGELGGVKFSGEVALNQSEDQLPGSNGGSTTANKWVGMLKAERGFGEKFGVDGEVYYISPQWMTSRDNLLASEYFNETRYHRGQKVGEGDGKYSYENSTDDYLIYPRPLGNNWNHIDDNDDNDPFVESERRRYPSDLNANDDRNDFWDDGTLKWDSDTIRTLTLPNGMQMPYDDPDGVVASRSDRNKNGDADYREDFLLFSSDPPVFELGLDLNNNGLDDSEDDDLLPDYFSDKGRSVGYVITGDGIRTLGIQGFALNFRWTPLRNTALTLGGIMESVVDRDLVLDTDVEAEDAAGETEGTSQVVYLTAKQEVIKRSQGLQYEVGAEVRGIKDAIRNDAVISEYDRFEEAYDVEYSFYRDPLDYRQAAVANLIGSVTYNNIRNFEYGFRARAGVDKHFEILDEDGKPVLFYSPPLYGRSGGFYQEALRDNKWEPYPNRIVGRLDLVNRLMYRIGFEQEWEDWRSMFNFLNRLEVIPQYKIGFSGTRQFQGPVEAQEDPGDIRKHLEMDKDGDGRIDPILDDVGDNLDSVDAALNRYRTYERFNEVYLQNVPILRLGYKIAENTQFQLGLQWLRYQDLLRPEDTFLKFTTLGQIVSKANYKGYSVTFFLGAKWTDWGYDVNARDPVVDKGTRFDRRGYKIFARLFSGI